MSHPSKVVIVGPLAVLREQLTTEFVRLGYASSTVARHLQLLAHLSRWMSEREVDTADLSWADVGRFCSDHELSCMCRFAPPPVMILMRLIRPECVPSKTTKSGTALPPETEQLLVRFGEYLRDERALMPTTRALYLQQLRVFALWFVAQFGSDLTGVTIAAVDQFYIDRAGDWSTSSARSSTIALRALAQWLFLTGRSASNLSTAILTVKDGTQDSLPKALPLADVESLLSVKMSLRDRAILLVLTRLGLRANEVAALTLDDFDWRAGTVLIHGKGNDSQLMPVPGDVGEAIAEYLSVQRRTKSPYRELFLGNYTPNCPLSRSSISMVVTYLAERAGITGRVGAHRLRHSAATAVLAGGGTLAEAGQLLRHRSSHATMIYAKTDLATLAQLAKPWPGSTGQENAHE